MWGLLMFYLVKCSRFRPPSLANYFWSGWQLFESLHVCEKMVRAWVQHHTVFKEVPQKHNDTLTDMGLSALRLRPKHYSLLLLLFHFSLVLNGSQSKTLKGVALPIYWSTFSYLSLIHLPGTTNKIQLILQSKPQSSSRPSTFHTC